MNNIICPGCGKIVEISEALLHQEREKIALEERSKYKEELEKARKEAEEKAKKRIEDDFNVKLKTLQEDTTEKEERIKKLIEDISQLTKQMRELKTEKDEAKLQMEKKLAEEEEKIRFDAQKKAEEEQRLKILEKEKQLQDALKANEEMRRKLQQGSQQSQGEVLELDLEEQLKNNFTFDEFLPIPKGIEGGDIWQKVRNKHGQEAGSMLWEIKRTKAWSKSWLPKLREDARRVNASVCILISDVLPDGLNYYERIDGVWVCSYSLSVVLAKVLREGLLQIAIAKSSATHKDEKLQEIYDYIVSEAFRHKIESHFESVKVLQEDLESEKRAMERIWKKREVQIQRLGKSMSQMFGEIQGIAGPSLSAARGTELLVESNEEIDKDF